MKQKACCREVPVTSSRHVAPPLSLHTTIMNILRKLTGTTTTPDAGDKRIREEITPNGDAKKPHKVKQQIQLGESLTALATSSVLGIGKFPTPRHISTTMSHPKGLPEPTPRLLTRRAPAQPSPKLTLKGTDPSDDPMATPCPSRPPD